QGTGWLGCLAACYLHISTYLLTTLSVRCPLPESSQKLPQGTLPNSVVGLLRRSKMLQTGLRKRKRASLTGVGAAILALAFGLAGADPCYGDIIFEPKNDPQPDEENILFQVEMTANLLSGHTNQSNVGVNFSSTQLIHESGGQSDIDRIGIGDEMVHN